MGMVWETKVSLSGMRDLKLDMCNALRSCLERHEPDKRTKMLLDIYFWLDALEIMLEDYNEGAIFDVNAEMAETVRAIAWDKIRPRKKEEDDNEV